MYEYKNVYHNSLYVEKNILILWEEDLIKGFVRCYIWYQKNFEKKYKYKFEGFEICRIFFLEWILQF